MSKDEIPVRGGIGRNKFIGCFANFHAKSRGLEDCLDYELMWAKIGPGQLRKKCQFPELSLWLTRVMTMDRRTLPKRLKYISSQHSRKERSHMAGVTLSLTVIPCQSGLFLNNCPFTHYFLPHSTHLVQQHGLRSVGIPNYHY